MNEVEFYLEDLKSKFSKINPNEYYLAYSGGRDSHFLLWFIKEYLHESRIPAVFSNTGMEIPEIRDRGLANADVILKPAMKHAEIKEKFGIPLNSKTQDEYVYRYQQKKREGVTDDDMPIGVKYFAMRQIEAGTHGRKTGKLSRFSVNKKTSEAMINGTLHKVSSLCCEYMKKKPGTNYEKQFGRKPILGIMESESEKRKVTFKSCFNKKMHFTPLWDLTEDLRTAIEKYCGIPVPSVYRFLYQTGCAGCPYGQHGKKHFEGTNLVLSLCGEGQRKFILDYFAESYAFKEYAYQPRLFI